MITYLALGSNLGDREMYLRSGIRALQQAGIELTRCASVYETEPKELLDQPWFLNTVIESNTTVNPELLLETCLEVERKNRRIRDRSNGPRTLDIDIILHDGCVMNTALLVIPHPRYANRRFVLEPLAELASDFIDPALHVTIGELLRRTTDTAAIRKVGPPLFH